MKKFNEKTEGRILTDTQKHIDRIKAIIEEIDDFEYSYLPDDFVTVYKGNFDMIYNGKFYNFDIAELEKRCYSENIPCGCIVGEYDYHYGEVYANYKSITQAAINFYSTGFWTKDQLYKFFDMDYLN